MNIRIKPTIYAMVIPALGAIFSATAQADATTCYYESQYGVTNPWCGNYKSETSPAKAYIDTVAKRDREGKSDRDGKGDKSSKHAVIIDVRSTPEYKAGHPEHAYNVPYPFIYRGCTERYVDGACKTATIPGTEIPQPDQDFVDYVETIIPNKDTLIYTLCRTGHRSVGAAHALADAGYTNVRNIWEGFVGVYLLAPQFKLDSQGNPVVGADGKPVIENAAVDLNHDDQLTDEDKNGWRYHQELPYDTRLLPKLIYQPRADTYDWD